MKKYIMYALMAMAATMVSAQEKLKIELSDGKVEEFNADDVARIFFDVPEEYADPVDLGLGVMWATCNVGAKSPEEIGEFYAWGETFPKDRYGEDNYVYRNLGFDIAGTEYDAATALWGPNWRMPTLSEAQELVDRCTWKKTTLNGVPGYNVTGPNGNSIFFPTSGYIADEDIVSPSNFYCHTGTNATTYATMTSSILPISWSFGSDGLLLSMFAYNDTGTGIGKYYGMPIRPVQEIVMSKKGGEGASDINPKDMTHAIQSPNYDDNVYYGWRGTDPNQVDYGCFEQWYKDFDTYQDINGLPAGTYELSVQGFYRKGYSYVDYGYFVENDTMHDYATLYAISSEGRKEVPFVCCGTGVSSQPISSVGYTEVAGGYVPNSMEATNKWFQNGNYRNSLLVKVGADGILRIGFRKDRTLTGDWVIVDNWRLTYYGPDSTRE